MIEVIEVIEAAFEEINVPIGYPKAVPQAEQHRRWRVQKLDRIDAIAVCVVRPGAEELAQRVDRRLVAALVPPATRVLGRPCDLGRQLEGAERLLADAELDQVRDGDIGREASNHVHQLWTGADQVALVDWTSRVDPVTAGGARPSLRRCRHPRQHLEPALASVGPDELAGLVGVLLADPSQGKHQLRKEGGKEAPVALDLAVRNAAEGDPGPSVLVKAGRGVAHHVAEQLGKVEAVPDPVRDNRH